MASGSDDHTVRLWSSNGNCLRVLQGHRSWVSAVAFSPDGSQLASGSEDQSVRLWDSYTHHCIKVLQGYNSGVWSVAFSPDGNALVSGGQDRLVRLWNISRVRKRAVKQENSGLAEEIEEVTQARVQPSQLSSSLALAGHDSWIWSVAFAPEGQAIASASEDGTIRLWKISSPLTPHPSPLTLKGHSHAVWSVAFSPDGQMLASGSLDSTIRLWDSSTGECWQTLQKHSSGIWSVAFSPMHDSSSPNRYLLASGSQDQTVQLWEINTKIVKSNENKPPELITKCLKTLEGHTSWIRCVAFSPDGEMLVSGSSDGMIKLWKVATGECLQTIQAHISLVLAVAFSPDKQIIATSGGDGVLKLWDVSQLLTGDRNGTKQEDYPSKIQNSEFRLLPLQTLNGHQKWVRFLAYSPDGKTLASCSQDGTVRLWDSSSGACLEVLRVARPYEGTNITGVKGLTQAQKDTLKALGAVDLEG